MSQEGCKDDLVARRFSLLQVNPLYDQIDCRKVFGVFYGSLYHWFGSNITSRKQRVVIDGEYSDWCNITPGVPQGSKLRPVLFLLYINDLSDCVSNNTNVALFAADIKIYREINSLDDCLLLQHDMIVLVKLSKTWKQNFDCDKCKVLIKVARVIK